MIVNAALAQLTDTRSKPLQIPAPAAESRNNKSVTVATVAKRTVSDRANIPPGPGSYEIPADLGPDCDSKKYQAVNFGKHGVVIKGREPLETPGPGDFVLPQPKSGAAFSFGDRFDGIQIDHPAIKARRQLVRREEHQPQFIDPPSLMGSSPGVKISPLPRRGKRNVLLDRSVGPGSYEPKEFEYSEKYTIARREAKKRRETEESPGPGDYNPETAISYLFSAVGLTISSVKHEPEKKDPAKDTPGPGAYDPNWRHFILVVRFILLKA